MGREEIGLNASGREQSRVLAESLQPYSLNAIVSSPILRARETAAIIAEPRQLEVQFDERLWEIDYGDWVGKTFEEIRAMPGYVPYFRRLATPVAPGGETLDQVRQRVVDFINSKKSSKRDEAIAVVSHADTIKCMLMNILNIPFENIWKFRIDNVSVSLLEIDKQGERVICINQRGDLGRLFQTRFSF